MAFYYYPEDGPSDGVPFEIQVLTHKQHRMKLYGRWSDLFYKLDTEFTPDDQPHLDRLAKRGRAEREMAPGSTIQSISEALAISPEIPFVFNKLFRSVDTAKGQRILVPPGLEGVASELSDGLAQELGESGNLTVLPTAKVSEGQFKDALNMFSRDLARDKNILDALALVKQSEAGNKRTDGLTSTLEGHILPVALSALMQAIQSGKIWDSDKLDPSEYMSNIVTIAILHDYVEAALEGIEDEETIWQTRQDIIDSIQDRFGTDISEGVAAMTLPMEIKDQDERREQYRRNLQTNGYARIIKPIDRWQNHVTDLIKLASGLAEAESDLDKQILHEQIMAYFAKTDRHQSTDFTSQELSEVYHRVHNTIWQIARHFGYKPEAK
jgi:hypothetical protein